MLKSKEIKVSRPKYDQKSTAEAIDDDDDDEAEESDNDDEEDVKPAIKTSSKLDKFKHKANHEATSDEDEE